MWEVSSRLWEVSWGAKKLPQSEASLPPGGSFFAPTTWWEQVFLVRIVGAVSSSEASTPPGGPCDWRYYETTPRASVENFCEINNIVSSQICYRSINLVSEDIARNKKSKQMDFVCCWSHPTPPIGQAEWLLVVRCSFCWFLVVFGWWVLVVPGGSLWSLVGFWWFLVVHATFVRTFHLPQQNTIHRCHF